MVRVRVRPGVHTTVAASVTYGRPILTTAAVLILTTCRRGACLVSKARLSSGSRMFATGSHVLCASEYPFHLQPYGREPATVGDGACNRMQ